MAQKPVPTTVKLGSSNLFIPQKCSECKFFKRLAHPAYEKPCSVLEVLPEAKPCERFMADPHKLKFAKPRHANMVSSLMRELSMNDLRTIASLAMQERKTRRNGFYFGDIVYIRVFGDDYISNYRRVVVVAADELYVQIEANQGFTAMLYHDSIMSADAWTTHRRTLEEREKINDPRYGRYIPDPTQAKLQSARIKASREALDLDITNGGPIMAGARPERRADKYNTPITELIVERRNVALPKTIRVR